MTGILHVYISHVVKLYYMQIVLRSISGEKENFPFPRLAYNIIRLSQFRFHIIRQRFDARVEDSHREKEEACKPARNREIAEGLR